MDDKQIEKILEKMPDNTAAMGIKDAKKFLRGEFDANSNKQIEKVEIINRIWDGIISKPPKNDLLFKCWFKEWFRSPINEIHVKLVIESTKSISKEYNVIYKKFNHELT